jgi:hypothetical protein
MDASDTTRDASLIQISSGQETFTSPATVSHVVQDNTLHAVSQLHDDEVEEFALAQDSTLQTAPVESIPSSVPSTAIHHRPPHQ